ncbi:hypothetical protein M0812_30214 [Anaeramoeba flamelloides]|uniref:N-acetyltransferase domain-containing protein n=1 Tax=Anaeramoeba flamelloides TaxID=1746091 RepID=A0AAV7Y4B3_9EUKA|nr:hypothetical protein M0812_30214 [Anaeramoeba flamelloides]
MIQNKTKIQTTNLVEKILTEEDLEESIRLVTTLFVNHEPKCIVLNFKYSDFEPFVRFHATKSLSDRLSIIVKDRISDKIVAASINEDCKKSFEQKNQTSQTHMNKILCNKLMLEELKKPFFSQLKPQIGEYFHSCFIVVDPNYAGLNLGTQLIKSSERVALERGFASVVCEATSSLSQHLYKKNGYTTISKLEYAKFEFNGELPCSEMVTRNTEGFVKSKYFKLMIKRVKDNSSSETSKNN